MGKPVVTLTWNGNGPAHSGAATIRPSRPGFLVDDESRHLWSVRDTGRRPRARHLSLRRHAWAVADMLVRDRRDGGLTVGGTGPCRRSRR